MRPYEKENVISACVKGDEKLGLCLQCRDRKECVGLSDCEVNDMFYTEIRSV